ncbi:MAG: hypothetical protein RMX96_05005 [Nostoc sp. ChiSLP02]|nr:hypothetical protein [Nostoc sp. DedSLP05]MDZ8102782.1 hypothetical protein [Nostoc sp. DedSLP01]MDZ8184208.1 hypothetical protein [Nostoc sp. ChiSLP02]
MKICNPLLGLTIGVLSTASISDICNLQKATAQSVIINNYQEPACGKSFTGTYLTTIKDTKGKFSSRGLITLTKEGNFIVSDSNQGGISGKFNPFTTAQGTWVCTGKNSIAARAIDFSFSNRGGTGIARIDYTATFDPKTQTVQGKISLRLFELQANPLSGNGQDGGTSFFTGKFVTAK